jgi:XTP/dITP diphosphohydrolase
VEETGESLEANAILKAEAAARASRMPALADDTGLEVDALGGAPGVYSARYAGPAATYRDNCTALLRALEGVPEPRAARFRTVVALALPGGVVETVDGTCSGRILTEARGSGGFGYDPVFVPDGETRTFAEMSPPEKHAVSHRGRAFRAARVLVARHLGV